MATQPVADDKKKGWQEWLLGQPPLVVMLFVIVIGLGYGLWYGVPAVLSQIQAGYEVLDQRHAAERKEMRDDAKSDRAEFREAIQNNTQALERLTSEIKK